LYLTSPPHAGFKWPLIKEEVQRGEGMREWEGNKGEERDRKWRSVLSLLEKHFLWVPML